MTSSTTTSPSSSRGHVLVLGRPSPAALRSIEEAAWGARLRTAVEPGLGDLAATLTESRPTVIVNDAGTAEAREACMLVRHEPQLANVPIITLVDAIDDLAFEELHEWGGDDLTLRGAPDALSRRLRLIVSDGAVPLSQGGGAAVVADADRRARMLAGRVLRNSGLHVIFATDAAEALREATRPEVTVVVQAAALDASDGPSLAAIARKGGVATPWVVTAPPREAARARARAAGLTKVTVHDAFSSPENVLFVINELTRGVQHEGRTSKRVLFGTTVRFRPAGGEQDESGFLFNISAGGLFVRTLAPPACSSEVWLELRPPRTDRRVRLEARVVWTRGFGPNDLATVPPGFALEVTGGSTGDLERFRTGYSAFAAQLLGDLSA